MTTIQTVNKEAVRMLVQDVGYALASAQTGIPQPTLRQWAKRGGWNGRSIPHSQAVTTVTRAPADAQAEIIAQRKEASAAHLSKFVVNASDTASKLNGKRALKEAQNVRHVAAVREHLWPQEKQSQANVMVNIALLGVDPQSVQVRDDAAAHPIELVESTDTDEPAAAGTQSKRFYGHPGAFVSH